MIYHQLNIIKENELHMHGKFLHSIYVVSLILLPLVFIKTRPMRVVPTYLITNIRKKKLNFIVKLLVDKKILEIHTSSK